MFSLDEKIFSANVKESQRIQTLIIGRLLLTFLLVVAGWMWHSGKFRLSIDNFPQGLLLLFVLSVGLTIVYFFVLRLSKRYKWQIRIQFLVDLLLITWLVWRTGDLTSPYITLYIVLISVAGVFLKARETLMMAFLCLLFFTILSVSAARGIIPSGNSALDLQRIVEIISFHGVAFMVVGFLASRFSERYISGEQLKETAKILANLQVLHERIIESIRSGLITTDLEGNIYTFNASATEITGYKPEAMLGKPIAGLLGNIEKSISLSLETTESGDQQPRFETDLITPEGFAVRVGYSIAPLFSESGESSGLIITFQDLTEIRSMEENVRRKDRLAAVGRVAAGLAHEIRNPLGAMRGAIQVLQLQTPPESSQGRLMDIVLRESDRLNSIITNFLTYARPRVSNFSDTDVSEAINDTFTLLRHSPDVKENHVLEADLPKRSVLIAADSTQLKQIFWNLARNSIQAMPDGGIFRVRLEEMPNNRIKIIFSDTGNGMSPEQVERLFEPFSNSTTGGTGLGLSIVYQIIRDHHGTINVRSAEGKGTTITIELPSEFRANDEDELEDEIDVTLEPSHLKSFLNIKNG